MARRGGPFFFQWCAVCECGQGHVRRPHRMTRSPPFSKGGWQVLRQRVHDGLQTLQHLESGWRRHAPRGGARCRNGCVRGVAKGHKSARRRAGASASVVTLQAAGLSSTPEQAGRMLRRYPPFSRFGRRERGSSASLRASSACGELSDKSSLFHIQSGRTVTTAQLPMSCTTTKQRSSALL
jgi:hypothetical protein